MVGGGCVIDQLCRILEGVDADELAHLVAPDEDEGILINLLGPFDVPPTLYVDVPSSRSIETAVTPVAAH